MPQRPSKKKAPPAEAKPGAPKTGNPRSTDEHRRDLNTKSVLDKFQGRKSI
ncbi:MAG: hypothetical protein JWO81_3514 [Alphaproteobacteria bacterium]|nr:hypothetical protein [Alphaproteobacteria bacterium]